MPAASLHLKRIGAQALCTTEEETGICHDLHILLGSDVCLVRWETALTGYLVLGIHSPKLSNTSLAACKYTGMVKLLQTELRIECSAGYCWLYDS